MQTTLDAYHENMHDNTERSLLCNILSIPDDYW